MALHKLLDIEIGVPNPALLDGFFEEIGFHGGAGRWGPSEEPDQIRVVEAPYRQLRRMRVGCEEEADLAAAARRLDGLGVDYQLGGGRLEAVDPINAWTIVVEPAAPASDVSPQLRRLVNGPGERPRLDVRADALLEDRPRPPRRLYHVMICTPDPHKTTQFLTEGMGLRVSDTANDGAIAFLRCSPDHHNVAIAPSPVPYLNHYALEFDDFDAVMRAASVYVRAHGDEAHIAGPGRHPIGANIFRYMLDPTGTICEFSTDMDYIENDDAWVVRNDWDLGEAWSPWGEKEMPEVFLQPADMPEIAAGWERAHA